jgi:hypothetical protein
LKVKKPSSSPLAALLQIHESWVTAHTTINKQQRSGCAHPPWDTPLNPSVTYLQQLLPLQNATLQHADSKTATSTSLNQSLSQHQLHALSQTPKSLRDKLQHPQ